jgi:hypothetical protein
MNTAEHDPAHIVSLANGRVLRVVADAPDSVRLEEGPIEAQTEAQTYSVTLTGRDIYNLSNAMVEALRGSRIRARGA